MLKYDTMRVNIPRLLFETERNFVNEVEKLFIPFIPFIPFDFIVMFAIYLWFQAH